MRLQIAIGKGGHLTAGIFMQAQWCALYGATHRKV